MRSFGLTDFAGLADIERRLSKIDLAQIVEPLEPVPSGFEPFGIASPEIRAIHALASDIVSERHQVREKARKVVQVNGDIEVCHTIPACTCDNPLACPINTPEMQDLQRRDKNLVYLSSIVNGLLWAELTRVGMRPWEFEGEIGFYKEWKMARKGPPHSFPLSTGDRVIVEGLPLDLTRARRRYN